MQLIKEQADHCKKIMIKLNKIMKINDFIFVSKGTAKFYCPEVSTDTTTLLQQRSESSR